MKGLLIGLMAILAVSLTRTARAQENVEVTVGLKTWYATWTRTFDGEDTESDPAFLIGPAADVRYGNLFGGIIYKVGTFKFPDPIDEELDMKDLDFWAGYYVHPRVGILVGGKYMGIDGDATLKGPVGGVNFNFPIGETGWVVFGHLNYLYLAYEQPDIDLEEYARGFAVELAGAYSFEAVPIQLTAGYQVQNTEGDDFSDEFMGVTLGANYTFQ
jgi:hypothetical protein